jgi:hypothetical protein
MQVHRKREGMTALPWLPHVCVCVYGLTCVLLYVFVCVFVSSVELLLSLVVPLVEGIKAQAMGLPPPLPTEDEDSTYHSRPKSYDGLGKKGTGEGHKVDKWSLKMPRTIASIAKGS